VSFSFYQDRIAKPMGPVVHGAQLFRGSAQGGVVCECFEQLVMTGAGLMHSRKNRIDNAELASRTDALGRQPIAGVHAAVLAGSVFQCAHDCRADRDNAATMPARALEGGDGGL
jgi:hypothetical protein